MNGLYGLTFADQILIPAVVHRVDDGSYAGFRSLGRVLAEALMTRADVAVDAPVSAFRREMSHGGGAVQALGVSPLGRNAGASSTPLAALAARPAVFPRI